MAKKPDFRPYVSGLLPLFMLAHFGHHVVGAMLRPLMPMIRSDLNLSYTQAGVVISVFAITNGISQLLGGWLADRFGPRLMILVSVSGVAIVGLLIGLSPVYVMLIIFLVVSAMIGGGYHPASTAAISSAVPSEHRGRALGLHMIGGSSAFWVVPLLAAPIAVAWGWRSSYIILSLPTIIFGVVLYVLISRKMKAPADQHQPAMIETQTKPTGIRWGQFLPFFIMSVTAGTLVESATAYLSLYAVDHFGTTEAVAAALTAISPAVGLLAAPLGGYLSDRFGGIPVLVVVSALAVPLVYVIGAAPNVASLAVVMFAIGLVSNTRVPTSEAYIVGHSPERRRSTILGLYFFAGAEISGLLTPVVGQLIERVGFYLSFSIVSAALALVVLVCSFFLWKGDFHKE